MQVYAIRMFNFCRFARDNNSVVFDLTEKQVEELNTEALTMDEIYDEVLKNPIQHIEKCHIRNLLGIQGATGKNVDRSNGTGKSTVMEAICYALYDQVVKKNVNTGKIEKAGLSVVIKIDGKYPEDLRESFVEMIFEEKGKVYRLKRGRTFTPSQKNNSPFIEFECINSDGVESESGHRTKDTNQAILDVIGIDFDIFSNSVMFGQGDAGKFLVGTDKIRKEMLVSLLRLDNIVDGCLEAVRQSKNEEDKKIGNLRSQVEMLENAIKEKQSVEEIEKAIEEYKKNVATLERQIGETDKKIQDLNNSDVIVELEKITEAGKKVKAELEDLQTQRDNQLKEWKSLFNNTDAQLGSLQKSLTESSNRIDSTQKNIQSKKDDIASFDQGKIDKQLDIIQKAKEAKPKYSNMVEEANEKRDSLMKDIANWEGKSNLKKDDIKELQSQIEGVDDEFFCDRCRQKVSKEHIESEIGRLTKERKDIQARIDQIAVEKGKIDELMVELNKKMEKISDILFQESKVEANISSYKQSLERVKELEEDMKTQNSRVQEIKDDIKTSEQKKGEYKAKAVEVKKKYEQKEIDLNNKLEEMRARAREAQEEAKDIKKAIAEVENARKALSTERSDSISKIGSYEKEIENIKGLAEKRKAIEKEYSEKSKNFKRLLILEDAFGLDGIQTRIVQKYLPLLNVYVKEFLDILSDGEMTVELFVNDKSKVDLCIRGNISDNYPMLSGGEKELARLSVAIGLALLSFSRSNKKPEIICLDEIFGKLDPARVKNVFKLLSVLKDKFSRVLVISHRPQINDSLPHHIVLEKSPGNNGTSLVRGY